VGADSGKFSYQRVYLQPFPCNGEDAVQNVLPNYHALPSSLMPACLDLSCADPCLFSIFLDPCMLSLVLVLMLAALATPLLRAYPDSFRTDPRRVSIVWDAMIPDSPLCGLLSDQTDALQTLNTGDLLQFEVIHCARWKDSKK
jgi:hypothetical protein